MKFSEWDNVRECLRRVWGGFVPLITSCAIFLLWPYPSAMAAVVARHPYGTTSHLTRTGYEARDGLCAKFGGAGGKWMRMDFDWRVLERQPGVWNFRRYDDIVATAESNGVQIVGILSMPPERARPVWEHLEAWAAFVRTTATRYRGRVVAYEVWNEEDAAAFWGYEPNPTNYTALLKASYGAIKSVDPSIRVLFGSITHSGLPFLEACYRNGAKDYCDIMNVHPYPCFGCPAKPFPEHYLAKWMADLRAVMARAGDAGKEVWITEIGWPAPLENTFKAPGVLRSGLRAIRPQQNTWRTLVIDARHDRGYRQEGAIEPIRRELPPGSDIVLTGFSNLTERLAAVKPDLLVVTPQMQQYPIAYDRDILDFARNGGVVVEFGGMPFYEGLAQEKRGTMGPWQLRRALGFEAQCWWVKDLPAVPREIAVFPTAQAPDVKLPKAGVVCQRFVSDRFLREGDTFIPLLTATWTNGVSCVGAAAIRYANGGGVVVCGILESLVGSFTEREQACYVPRTFLTAFELGVSTVMWYELRSHDYDRRDAGWGLLHLDLTEKPSWRAFETLARWRPAGSVALAVPPRKDGVHHVAWQLADGCRAGAYWTEGEVKQIAPDFGGTGMVFEDFMGRPVWPQREGEALRIRVSPDVIYYRTASRP